PEPERALMEALSALGQEAPSFAAEPGEGPSFLDELWERTGVTLRVDTEADGRVVASTTLGLGGDVVCALDAAARPDDLALHVRSIARAQRDRAAGMRILCLALQAAVKISVAVGTGNVFAALPAAWRFIRGVMTEWEQREQREQAA